MTDDARSPFQRNEDGLAGLTRREALFVIGIGATAVITRLADTGRLPSLHRPSKPLGDFGFAPQVVQDEFEAAYARHKQDGNDPDPPKLHVPPRALTATPGKSAANYVRNYNDPHDAAFTTYLYELESGAAIQVIHRYSPDQVASYFLDKDLQNIFEKAVNKNGIFTIRAQPSLTKTKNQGDFATFPRTTIGVTRGDTVGRFLCDSGGSSVAKIPAALTLDTQVATKQP